MLGSEVVRVARQDRVAHISKQSSDPFRSYLKCRSQIERVPSLVDFFRIADHAANKRAPRSSHGSERRLNHCMVLRRSCGVIF